MNITQITYKMKKSLLTLFLLFAMLHGFAQQVGVGTDNPNQSSALDVESTTKGFLPPRLTLMQLLAIASPAEGLLVYCTDCNNKGIYVYDGATFKHSSSGATAGITTTVVAVVGAGGATWMDRNLGASRVATSQTDSDAYGDLYQWGRFTDGHQSRTSSTVNTNSDIDNPPHGDWITEPSNPYDWRTPQNDNLWQGVNGINNPCPIGYRLPTETEWITEFQAWSSQDATGGFNSPLKLSLGGERSNNDGDLINVGNTGYYWTSTVNNGSWANRLIVSFVANINKYGARGGGASVRCIKN